MHYKHTHYVLVEDLKLGTGKIINWTLRGLWADATQEESGELTPKDRKTGGNKKPKLSLGLTDLHARGYVDKITANCTAERGQKSHQTRIWPPSLWSMDASAEHALLALESLVLKGISYTPRSLILKFKKLDLQVSSAYHSVCIKG